jgi:LAS superfamily LD-carboxypeptidase LdcB
MSRGPAGKTPALGPPAAPGAAVDRKPAGQAAGTPAAAKSISKEEFKKKVFDKQLAAAKKVRNYVESLADKDLVAVEGNHKMHRTAAPKCQDLLAAARAALKKAQDAKDKAALKVKKIGIVSAYRTAQQDQSGWDKVFETWYAKKKKEREATGDGHGDKAVAIMVKIMQGQKAVPGFSNHQHGLAVDFGTREGTDGPLAYVRSTSWFYLWLDEHAGEYDFQQLPSERWHFDYTGK